VVRARSKGGPGRDSAPAPGRPCAQPGTGPAKATPRSPFLFPIPLEEQVNMKMERTTRRLRMVRLAAMLVVLVVAAGACSGGSSDGGAGSSNRPIPAPSGFNGQVSAQFTQCMKRHGVDLSGLNPPAGSPAPPSGQFNPNNPALQRAQQACQRYLGNPPTPAGG
jgi:hypothetical protein